MFARSILFLLIFIIGHTSPLKADTSTTEFIDFNELPLEYLLEQTVTTASKSQQKVEDATAVIDVFTEKHIQNLNVTNLYELLSLLPGVEMMETFFGRTVLNIRGIMNLNYNNKVLLMIDGNPIYEPVNGAYFLEAIPMDMISKIEIVRGPGSPLYGTNAYSGVINVITRQEFPNPNEVKNTIGFGDFATVRGSAYSNLELMPETSLTFALGYQKSKGYPFNILSDERGNHGVLDYKQDYVQSLMQIRNKSFSFQAGYLMMDKMTYGITPNLNYSGLQQIKNFFTNAMYNHSINDSLAMLFSIRYNQFSNPSVDIGYFPYKGFMAPVHDTSTVHMESGGYIYSSELQFNYRLKSNFNIVAGLTYEYLYSDPYLFLWDTDLTNHPFSAYLKIHESYNYAGYFQIGHIVTDKFTINGGMRLVKNKEIKREFYSPCLAANYKISGKFRIKAQYGQAFRLPNFFEKYVATYNVLYGNEKLNPELIQTIDLWLETEPFNSWRFRLNGFFENTDDGIIRVAADSSDSYGENAMKYVNAESRNIYGIEFSFSGQVFKRGNIAGNFSWKTGHDSETNDALLYFAPYTANIWFICNQHKILTFTPWIQYVSQREGFSNRKITNECFGGYTIDAYTLVNLSMSLNFDNCRLKLSFKNLLNEDYSYPEYVRQLSETVPGGPGRNYFLSLDYQF